MNTGQLVVNGSTLLLALVAAGALIREWRRDRNQRKVDEATADKTLADKDQLRATIKQMAEETNRARDFRVWQLEGYVDLDRTWHREMVDLVEYLIELLRAELATNGKEMPEILVPRMPEVPSPRVE